MFHFIWVLLLSHPILFKSQSCAYTPNPRAIHPDGRTPTLIQAKRRVEKIRREIFASGEGDDTGNPTCCGLHILVDGNNIRNSFGFQDVSALQLTEKLSSWANIDHCSRSYDPSDHNDYSLVTPSPMPTSMPTPNIFCAWDGGSERVSTIAMSTLAAFSGPNRNADDLIVQTCAFLCSPRNHHGITTVNGSTSSSLLGRRRIIVFTSDANLANRCFLQVTEESPPGRILFDFQVYHSIYLLLLLDDQDGKIMLDNGRRCEGRNSIGALAPDWKQEERRASVDELQSFLERENGGGCEKIKRDCVMSMLCEWINNGLEGLEISRVTKGGSLLYQVLE